MEREAVRKAALQMGADVCGFAGMDRFDGAPTGFRPRDIFDACRTVVVFGIALPKGLLTAPPAYIYAYFNNQSIPRTDAIAFQLARLLEDSCGGVTVPLPCDAPVACYDAATDTKRGMLSMKHAAVAAGIGTLGKNTLLLSERFGNRLTIGAVLTDADFPSDPLAKPVCIDGCRLCLDVCPTQAISDNSVAQRPCRAYAYIPDALGFTTVQCNQCRTVCPMRFGQ